MHAVSRSGNIAALKQVHRSICVPRRIASISSCPAYFHYCVFFVFHLFRLNAAQQGGQRGPAQAPLAPVSSMLDIIGIINRPTHPNATPDPG